MRALLEGFGHSKAGTTKEARRLESQGTRAARPRSCDLDAIMARLRPKGDHAPGCPGKTLSPPLDQGFKVFPGMAVELRMDLHFFLIMFLVFCSLCLVTQDRW